MDGQVTLLTHLLTYLLTYLLIYALTYLLTYSLIYVLTHLLTYSLTHLLTYSLTHLLTYSLTHLLTYSLTHLLTYSLAHLLTHSLTHSGYFQEREQIFSFISSNNITGVVLLSGDIHYGAFFQLSHGLYEISASPIQSFPLPGWGFIRGDDIPGNDRYIYIHTCIHTYIHTYTYMCTNVSFSCLALSVSYLKVILAFTLEALQSIHSTRQHQQ